MLRTNKIALITGSAKGLGRITALSLAEQGCDVIINYLHSEHEAEKLVKEIRNKGVRSLAIRADITKLDEIKRLVHEAESNIQGHINILINNAGPFIRERKVFADYSQDEISYMMNGNLISAMHLDHQLISGMRKNKWGRIIHFGFGRASEASGWPHRAVYAAAKVGLVSFTKTLAAEEIEHGITVNMICPGDIRGENKEKMIKEVTHLSDDETPGKRPGAGEDVSRVIAFLCNEQSDFLTGNVIDVSGGFDPIRSLPIK